MDQAPTLSLPALLSAHLITLYPSSCTRVWDDCAFNNVLLDRHNRARRWLTVFFQFSLFILVIVKAIQFLKFLIDALYGAAQLSQRSFTCTLTNNNTWLPRHPLIHQLAPTLCAQMGIN